LAGLDIYAEKQARVVRMVAEMEGIRQRGGVRYEMGRGTNYLEIIRE